MSRKHHLFDEDPFFCDGECDGCVLDDEPETVRGDDDGDDGGLGAKSTTRDDVGTIDDGRERVALQFVARDRQPEDVALGVVPCPVDADGDPQVA